VPVSRGRLRRTRNSTVHAHRRIISIQEQSQPRHLARFAMRFRSLFYPWWRLLVVCIAVVSTPIGIYLNAIPDIHLATPSSTSPTEFAFYVSENSPFVSLHLRALNCLIVDYKGTEGQKEYTLSNNLIIQRVDLIIGTTEKQIYLLSMPFTLLCTDRASGSRCCSSL
jgi:hypothetical protein